VELPHVQKIYQNLSKQHDDLQILAVEINDDRKGAETFIKENRLTFQFAEADRDFVKATFNTAGYPNTFIIDRDGKIRQHHLGFRDGQEAQIEEELLAVLKKN
jgi:peroxiredoxin